MKSERMERVLEVLRTRHNPSTKEIEDLACVASARDYIRRLRDKGFTITMTEQWINYGRVCRYHLEETSPVARELFQQ
jgi:hypothetical protein